MHGTGFLERFLYLLILQSFGFELPGNLPRSPFYFLFFYLLPPPPYMGLFGPNEVSKLREGSHKGHLEKVTGCYVTVFALY